MWLLIKGSSYLRAAIVNCCSDIDNSNEEKAALFEGSYNLLFSILSEATIWDMAVNIYSQRGQMSCAKIVGGGGTTFLPH